MSILEWLRGFFHPLGPPPSPPRPLPPVTPPATAEQVMAELNYRRAAYRQAPLKLDDRLASAAQGWAVTMAASRTISHGGFQARMTAAVPGAAVGENVAEGQTTAAQVVADWMNSSGHRANILGDYNIAGVGIAADATGTTSYWCVDFARIGG